MFCNIPRAELYLVHWPMVNTPSTAPLAAWHRRHTSITESIRIFQMSTVLLTTPNGSEKHRNSMERECFSMADLANGDQVCIKPTYSLTYEIPQHNFHLLQQTPKRKSTEVNSEVPAMTRRAQAVHARLQPNNLLAKVRKLIFIIFMEKISFHQMCCNSASIFSIVGIRALSNQRTWQSSSRF